MVRKDRDVWEPPEDQPVPPAPPSAFQLHFQNRAVFVGKDGSNAQLVPRMKKPLKHARGACDANKVPLARHGPEPAASLSLSREPGPRCTGGICAPDELQKRPPLQSHPHQKAPAARAGVAPSVGCRPFRVPDVVCSGARPQQEPCAIATRASPERKARVDQWCTVSLSPPHSPSAHSTAVVQSNSMTSPDVSSVERVDDSWHVPADTQRFVTRPIRRAFGTDHTSVRRAPARPVGSPIEQFDIPSASASPESALVPVVGQGRPATCDDAGFGQVPVPSGGVAPVPVYQPTGQLFGFSPLTLPKHRKMSPHTRRQTRGADASAPVVQRRIPKSAPPSTLPVSKHTARPARLEPLKAVAASSTEVCPSSPPMGTVCACDAVVEDGSGKKREITYKPHTLKEYKAMMERVANSKPGHLGYAETEERRVAMMKMQRQRDYGEMAGRQIIEELRGKQQLRAQQHGSQTEGEEDGATVSCPRRVAPAIQQPPPAERVQAQERRARALEYARNLPRPAPAVVERRPRVDDASSSSLHLTGCLSPQDEAARRRRERLAELEARHRRDRDRVDTVKRKLGY
ncbi:putative protein of unknown function (DUF4591) [Trypanosoma vivax]|uniref:ADG2 n=1 Tax=Trypanosoma vivax (strain Y486) TaxID=1055687 RepID=G0TVW7_TRYVY|nr:putative protein of unknown function (DUF4591) [Trypanosoma vivax]KAH8607227.1 putative protein of unknown function (DUF4591) [Trypanosoma vivax]CCC48083.1 conserved hypothetical protein [Trypanosoma vivax Y486]